jgi:hypothetical protein
MTEWNNPHIKALTETWESYDIKPKNENGRSGCCDAECVVTMNDPKTGDILIESCSACRDMIASEDDSEEEGAPNLDWARSED